mgnify:CR=1 FL=1
MTDTLINNISDKNTAVIIDDQPEICRLIERQLRSVGFHVVGCAGSVSEGMTLLSHLKPDIVFLDERLPDGSGMELAKNMNLTTVNNCYTVIMSGVQSFYKEVLMNGYFYFVEKPFSLHEIITIRNRFIEHCRKQQTLVANSSSLPLRITVKTVDGAVFIDPKDVGFFSYAYDTRHWTMVYADGKAIVMERKYNSKWILMQSPRYISINRQTIINLGRLQRISKGRCIFDFDYPQQPDLSVNDETAAAIIARFNEHYK